MGGLKWAVETLERDVGDKAKLLLADSISQVSNNGKSKIEFLYQVSDSSYLSHLLPLLFMKTNSEPSFETTTLRAL
jgi:hypothetical protein